MRFTAAHACCCCFLQSEKHRKEEAERIEKDGQTVSKGLYYLKQTVGNACGTIGLVHVVAVRASASARATRPCRTAPRCVPLGC